LSREGQQTDDDQGWERTALKHLVKREAQVGILTQGESSFARARANSDAGLPRRVVSLIEVLDADSNLLQVRAAKAQAQNGSRARRHCLLPGLGRWMGHTTCRRRRTHRAPR